MAEFGAAATLSVSVDQSSLANAKSTIEDEMGSVSAGVGSPRPSQRMRTDGGIGGGGSPSLSSLAEERNELLTQMLDVLEQGSGPMGGGQGGGGNTAIIGGGAGALGGGLGAGLLGAAGVGTGFGGFASGSFGSPQGLGERLFQGMGPITSGGTAGSFDQLFGIGKAARTGAEFGQGLFGDATDNPASQLGNQLSNIEQPDWLSDPFANAQWPDAPNPLDGEWPEYTELSSAVSWPEYSDLSSAVSWPDVPDLSSETSWPSLPEPGPDFWPNPFSGNSGQQSSGERPISNSRVPGGFENGRPTVETTTSPSGGRFDEIRVTIDNATDRQADAREALQEELRGAFDRP